MSRSDLLVKLIGWPATVLHGDVSTLDRWLWLRKHLEGGPLRTLDAGCGSGAFTLYAAKIGNEAVGLSFQEDNLERAQARGALLGLKTLQFQNMDLRQLDRFKNELGMFEQIICLETLEHIRDDRKLLRDLASLLKPGGRLLVTTPYRDYKPLLGDRLSVTEDGGHVRWGYTHQELRALFAEAGLDLQNPTYISGWIAQKLINLQRRLERLGSIASSALVLPLRLFQIFDRPVTRLLNYPYLSVAVIGVRRPPES